MCEDFLQESDDGLSKIDGQVLPEMEGHSFDEKRGESRVIQEYSGTTCQKKSTESRVDITES